MIESAMESLPVLTDVLPPETLAPTLPDRLAEVLPGLLRETLVELQPQIAQQLFDALMPRLAAALAQHPMETAQKPSSTCVPPLP